MTHVVNVSIASHPYGFNPHRLYAIMKHRENQSTIHFTDFTKYTFSCTLPLRSVYESEQQVQKLKDSQVHQDFQIQDPYSIFQVPTQQEEELIN